MPTQVAITRSPQSTSPTQPSSFAQLGLIQSSLTPPPAPSPRQPHTLSLLAASPAITMPPTAPPLVDKIRALFFAIITVKGYASSSAWDKVADLLPRKTTPRAARNQWLKMMEQTETGLLLDPEEGHIPERKQFGRPKKAKVMEEGDGKKGEGVKMHYDGKNGGVDAKKPKKDIGKEGSQSGEGSMDGSNASLGGDEEPAESDSTDYGSGKTYTDELSGKIEIKDEDGGGGGGGEIPDYA